MKKNNLIFFLLLFFWGIIFSNQLNIIGKTYGNNTSSKKAELLKNELNSLKERKSQASKTLQYLDDELKKYKEKGIEKNISLKQSKDDLKTFELISGSSNVKGSGIIIKLDKLDSPENNSSELYDFTFLSRYYLLTILNILKKERAEAISINNERIIFNTNVCIKNNHLNINDKNINFPYVIKVIGDPILLEKRLDMRYGMLYDIRKDNVLNVKIEKKETIEIDKYAHTIKFKYAKPIE